MLKIILAVLTFPVWFPLLLAAGAVLLVLSIIVSLTGFAITAVAAGLSLAAILAFVIYLSYVSTSLASCLMGTGAGCILLGLGLLIGTAGVNLCVRLFPWLINLIKALFRKPFPDRRNRGVMVQGAQE